MYIGQTNNLEQKLKRHNGVLPCKSRSFTKINKGKWGVVYKETANSRQEAFHREKELKS
ncbi:GIY-YIG nuclease family protein [Candidatus Gottesmanbacteria bacterium]|nr:GIY-YIG nuclease family protein [Candidatus Gottesmanbacteria bacterium]